MIKVIFFPGMGTLYSVSRDKKETIEIYPEAISALRFLSRRGYELVLLTPEYSEYKRFRAAVKDKTLSLHNFNPEKNDLSAFMEKQMISEEESFLITDGLYWKYFQNTKARIILILSGAGFCTLAGLEDDANEYFKDICKNIYAAAFSVAINN
ncbi:MAG: hypothetical protein CVU87_00130 [Firmicutes bacterium HGW-Firmicutes-12]|jgi:hypothetical protein|nr:MAG: hypothetical protein CVU87_00130 [Firmicutes bacterium HGW-Firmicutes-12]